MKRKKQPKVSRRGARLLRVAAAHVRALQQRHLAAGFSGHDDVPVVEHCDDYIEDLGASLVPRSFLVFARAPAHGQLLPKPHPRLFADYAGTRVRVTTASRFGDVGITSDHDAEIGYEWRVLVRQLSNFSESP